MLAIAEIQTFPEPVFDAIVNEVEWQKFGKVMLKNGRLWKRVAIVARAVNDATLQKAGDISIFNRVKRLL